jgi:hypothetical protein
MEYRDEDGNPVVLSYDNMRRAVGIIALALPFVLSLGNILLTLIGPHHTVPQPLFEPSISAYYYTVAGRFLIGGLCAIAMFLMSCQGYDRNDEISGYLACIFALGVAFFPTTDPSLADPSSFAKAIGTVHLISAALLFLTLAYFCLCLFRKTSALRKPTRHKLMRNKVYTICGWTIIGSIAVMLSLNIPAVSSFLAPMNTLFPFETLALLAFGLAWLTKGNGFLADDPGEVEAAALPPVA